MQTLSFLILVLLSLSVFSDRLTDRQQELQYLIKHDCGSCHGMTLKGGLGSSLQPGALEKKSDELLFITIKEGRPGTPMPPWKSLLTNDDINIVIKLLRKGIN